MLFVIRIFLHLCSLLLCPTEKHFQINICHNFQFLHSPCLNIFSWQFFKIAYNFSEPLKSYHEGCLHSLSVFLNQFCLLATSSVGFFFFFNTVWTNFSSMFPAEVPIEPDTWTHKRLHIQIFWFSCE